jgi:hypothetical protein
MEGTMGTLGDFMQSDAKEIDILKNEIAIFKNLIKERVHPLDLVRELLSNAGAREVGAAKIEISYTKDREGHIFEICDNGCGMNFTGNNITPGRLDKFLGLGMSEIVGIESDEFSWKGLGSKLAYQSRGIEIETRYKGHPLYEVKINEPWDSLNRNLIPKPRISRYEESQAETGTRIRIIGHPPHRKEKPFSMSEIRNYLCHRTFAGFTKERENPPQISLSVLGNEEYLEFGFPEIRDIHWENGIIYDETQNRLIVNIFKKHNLLGLVNIRGFLAWEADRFGLEKNSLNTGLILSSRGIPYFELDMEKYGARSIKTYPGKGGTCLIVECDRVNTEMNISRSGLIDSEESLVFNQIVVSLMEELETSKEYLEKFRSIPAKKKRVESATNLENQKRSIEAEDQNFVVLIKENEKPIILIREPKNESEVNALIWKLEAISALPFEKFQTLGYVGAQKGPDLLVNFQEEKESEPHRAIVFEIENNFYSYTTHAHYPAQYPKVLCWDVPASGRKVRLQSTSKKYKYTVDMKEYQVHVYVIKQFESIAIMSRKDLNELGIKL